MAKTTTAIETTITHELSCGEVQEWLTEKKLIPADWKFFSIEVEGLGISKGAKITLKHSDVKR